MNLITGKLGVVAGRGKACSVPIIALIAIVVIVTIAYYRAATSRPCAQ